MTSDLTDRQKSVLDFISYFQREHQMAPSVREIATHFKLRSPAGVHRILNILRDKGFIVAEPGRKRAWRVRGNSAMHGIPLVGTIAAGAPLEAIENYEDELPVSPAAFGCNTCFGLRVKGDSMINAHILDGDIAIIRPQQQVETGDIAAVLVRDRMDEATLKIIRRTRTTLTLEPANPAYPIMEFKGATKRSVSILGRLVGIVRINH